MNDIRNARAQLRAARDALDENARREEAAGINWETDESHRLNQAVNDAGRAVPWWRDLLCEMRDRFRYRREDGYTHPDVFTTGIEQGRAEPEADPTRIDWPARQGAAAIPFEVVHGRPVNPCEKTPVRYGRNELGRWGENLMADALVTATTIHGRRRWLLMVERGDGYGWAVPGGHVEPGETGVQAAARELAGETGLAVPLSACRATVPLYVPDPRASDEAWAVTLPVHVDLGELGGLPAVTGADDARRAAWIAAGSYDDLVTCLEDRYALVTCLKDRYAGQVFAAHAGMLAEFLGSARQADPAPVEIISFGYGHGPAPEAHATIDVRHHFRDPHVDPALRYLTAADAQVVRAVLGTSGVAELAGAIVAMAHAFRIAPRSGPVVIAVGCVGGRHRSAAIAAEAARRLERSGVPVTLTHRDMALAVIERAGGPS